MTEVDMQAVRDRLDREDELLREKRQLLRRDHQQQAALLDSLALSERASRLGILPSVAWLFFAMFTTETISPVNILLFGTISTGIVYRVAPYAGSFAAYFWFRNSNFSIPLVAGALTLLIDAAHLGWAIFLTC